MPRKRRQIDAVHLLGLRSVPLSTARRVLEALPDLGFEYDTSGLRYDLKCARDEMLDGVLCIVDLPMDDGTTYQWRIGRPQRVLQYLSSDSDALKRVLQSMPSSPDAPLEVLHYHDEVTPGHLLAPVHNRAFPSFRFTFEQMGKYLLTCEEMWFEYAILRTTVLERVTGGMSTVMATLLRIFFTCSSEGLIMIPKRTIPKC